MEGRCAVSAHFFLPAGLPICPCLRADQAFSLRSQRNPPRMRCSGVRPVRLAPAIHSTMNNLSHLTAAVKMRGPAFPLPHIDEAMSPLGILAGKEKA